MAGREDPQEEPPVQQQNNRVEKEPRDVEDETLVDPFLALVQLDGVQVELEVVLNTLERQTNELKASKHYVTYLKPDNDVYFAHLLFIVVRTLR